MTETTETPTPAHKPMALFNVKYLAIAGLGLLLSYAIIDRAQPVSDIEVTMLNTPYPGEDLLVNFKFNREKQCATKIQRTIFDSAKVKFSQPITEYQINGEIGPEDYSVRIPVSPDATPGKGKLRLTTAWVCNYVHIVWPIVEIEEYPIEIASRFN